MQPLQSPQGQQCVAYLESLLRHELSQPIPDVAKLSIALGAVEHSLTRKDDRGWPADLPAAVARLHTAFETHVGELAASAALAAAATPAARVKAIADAVWGKLNKGYSKDLQHAQHVYSFAALLLPGGVPGVKKQLDCAGVVTTTYALCHALARTCLRHADLAAVRMQVSEDHCWLQLGGDGGRATSVEVTTDTAAKRGLPVAPAAWDGWLYTGGRAVLCSPHRALAALVASLNPALAGGKKGSGSEELHEVQQRLLEVLLEVEPGALYPAALCALADLKEGAAEDELEAARDGGDAARLAQLLRCSPGDERDLFERAVRLASLGEGDGAASSASVATGSFGAAGDDCAAAALQIRCRPADGPVAVELRVQQARPGDALQHAAAARNGVQHAHAALTDGATVGTSLQPGRQWYVYSYLAAFLARRAAFLASCAAGFGEQYWDAAVHAHHAALQAAANGAPVLAGYRFSPSTDEQLFKDVEGVLEEVVRDGLLALAKRQPGIQLADPAPLASLLLLWDGVCQLFAGKAKPSGWVALLMRLAKLFSPEAREAAAAAVEGRVGSGPMLAARPLWRELKAMSLKPLFESADVGPASGEATERSSKRQRR